MAALHPLLKTLIRDIVDLYADFKEEQNDPEFVAKILLGFIFFCIMCFLVKSNVMPAFAFNLCCFPLIK